MARSSPPTSSSEAQYGSTYIAPPNTAPRAEITEPSIQVVRRSRRRKAATRIQDAEWVIPELSGNSERGPLLATVSKPESEVNSKRIIYQELATLVGYAIPAFLTHFLEYSLLMAPIISIGHLSTTALAAGTLASMTASVTGLTIAHSFASALDSILPAAWTSGNPSLVGLWTQRMLVIIAALNIPILTVWWNAEPILLGLRQDPEVAHLASIYLRWLSLGFPAFTMNAVLRRYFQCQGLFSVPTQIILVIAPINAILNYLLVWGPRQTRLGFIGGPIATAISFNLVSLFSVGYLLWLPDRQAWHPFTSEVFQNLGMLTYLGVAGVGQIATEWWAWEIIDLSVSLIGKTSLAAQSVLIVSCTTTYQAPYSIALGTAVRIGNLLGEQDSSRARLVARVSFLLAAAVGAAWCVMFVLLRKRWAYIFNSDPEVLALVSRLLPFVGVLQLLDGISTVGSGILRACGQQGIAAVMVLVAYYIVGIPLGVFLAFSKKFGLLGLWIGLSAALIMTVASVVYLSARVDWSSEAENARRRLEETGAPTPTP